MMIAKAASRVIDLGVVSFLNARPLIEGLRNEPCIRLRPAVPSRLAEMMHRREVSISLVPVVDFARNEPIWQIVSDACIASDGQTFTVRVFSRVPPPEVRCIHADVDSHTSVVLARLIWRERFGREVSVRPLGVSRDWADCQAVLLIGDKVVTQQPQGFAHDVDLGTEWKEWTGLPFVFAIWVARGVGDWDGLAHMLSAARDRGVADARRLARKHGPAHGWPIQLAEVYLTRYMRYVLTPQARQGMDRFMGMARAAGLLARPGELVSA